MADITMSLDDTLELDAIIKKWNAKSDDAITVTSNKRHNLKGLNTYTGVFDPQESGKHTIKVNGQELTVEVTETSTIPENGVSYYTFDNSDTVSGKAIDLWGNNDAQISGATTGVAGANQTYNTSEGYDFVDGDVVDTNATVIPNDAITSFSVAFWMKPDTKPQYGHDPIKNSSGITLRHSPNNDTNGLLLNFYDGSNALDKVSPVNAVNTWSHVVVTYDGSKTLNGMTIYLDGSVSSPSSTRDEDPSESLGSGTTTIGNNFDGTLDDVRFYNKELTSTEASNLYNNGSIL